jgi:hypothetical protein
MGDERCEHPAPWQWEETAHMLRLVDATHGTREPTWREGVIFYVEREDNDGRVRMPQPVPSPRVRALTEAAPETFEALRKSIAIYDTVQTYIRNATGDGFAHGSAAVDEMRELIARIDERSKGGG